MENHNRQTNGSEAMDSPANPSHKKRNLIIGVLAAAAAIAVGVTFSVGFVPNGSPQQGQSGESSETNVFSIDSEPYGLTYGEWAARWWLWLLSIPSRDDPSDDKTGEKCAINQVDEHVWFLSGHSPGRHETFCKVPLGKAIFIPLLTGLCDYHHDTDSKTESELRACAFSGIRGASMQLSINGMEIRNVESYRVQSPLFDLTVPPDNFFGLEPINSTRAAADGYYVMVEPLPTGQHAIGIKSSIVGDPVSSFATDGIYNLEVK
ncbi:MAG TPA: hypothetical protein VKA40_03580 [Nitrososphaera sp.]|nr:hypothetical protein [Nitrososphaera sp.]HKI08946.1 hypothetical protein [Nitrososphaeraceae archaeon]